MSNTQKYNYIGAFDMLKIGIGPSSSHTLGPWRAAEAFLKELKQKDIFDKVEEVEVELRGSLSLTGKGHFTHYAAMLGLSGQDPEYIPVDEVRGIVNTIYITKQMNLGGVKTITFDPDKKIIFNNQNYGFHPNGIIFRAKGKEIQEYESCFFSIGGGFIVKSKEEMNKASGDYVFPYEIRTAEELSKVCKIEGKKIWEIVYENEKVLRSPEKIDSELNRIWKTMIECIYTGCHTHGEIEGGLKVVRRSSKIYDRLKGNIEYEKGNLDSWVDALRSLDLNFNDTLNLVSSYALAVNEVNASLGRVVTAPTNGSSGIIPATIMYYLTSYNKKATDKEIRRFLLTAGMIGSLFKRHATISAAEGGCQAETGVSSSMAAGALCDLMGGTVDQALVAAEMAMEHHLGMTCDPIGGLVQIPCIERNGFSSNKAIVSASLALTTDPKKCRVTLDEVIKTLKETGDAIPQEFRETAEGGLAKIAASGKIFRCQ